MRMDPSALLIFGVLVVTSTRAGGAERPPRLGLMLGGSLLSRDESNFRGRGGSSVAFELGYGPYREDVTTSCVTDDFPTITHICLDHRATAGAALAGIQYSHEFGRRGVRPWAAAGAGLMRTWFQLAEAPLAGRNSQTLHLAGGLAARRWRLETRVARVLHHPHPGPFNESGEARTQLQLRLTLFPFAR
jgi:hypothetical protein